MRRIALLLLVFGCLAPIFASVPAHAQATRTWVSGVGDDANPCSRTAPCKTFAGAISKTATAGEINCLDPGGFGGVTIIKSITLNCTGTLGSVLVAGTPGVTINAPAGSIVVLRGLQITGVQGGAGVAGTIGVRILAAAVVSIENCVITQFGQQGIADTRSDANAELFIRNTVVSHNAGTGIASTAASNKVQIENTSSINNNFGLAVGNGTLVMATRSVFSGNSTAGIEADSGGGINIDSSVIANNGTGVQSSNNIRLSNTDVSFNGTGITGVSVSFGNNRITGNGSPGTAPTPAGAAAPAVGQQ